MLRRGLVRVAVVVRCAGPANDVAEVSEGEVVVGHASTMRPGLRSCTNSRSAEQVPRVPAHWTARDVEQLVRALAHETIDSLAAVLGVHRSIAADLRNGTRRWTEHQRGKLGRGAA